MDEVKTVAGGPLPEVEGSSLILNATALVWPVSIQYHNTLDLNIFLFSKPLSGGGGNQYL